MSTQCNPGHLQFQALGKRTVTGTDISSDGGSPLPREVDGRLDVTARPRRDLRRQHVRRDSRGRLAGKSASNRPEPGPDTGSEGRHKVKIRADFTSIDSLITDTWMETYATPPKVMAPDADATDGPLGGREERLYHGFHGEAPLPSLAHLSRRRASLRQTGFVEPSFFA